MHRFRVNYFVVVVGALNRHKVLGEGNMIKIKVFAMTLISARYLYASSIYTSLKKGLPQESRVN